jgi:uncharacterized membrane protein
MMKTTILLNLLLTYQNIGLVSGFVAPNNFHRSTATSNLLPPSNIVSASSSSSSSLSFFKKNVPEPEPEIILIQGVGEEGCNLPSPSGVNTLSTPVQAAIFFGIFAGLGALTVPFSSFLSDITMQYEWVQTWRYTWPFLGAIYAAAGVTHFTLQDAYENVYPQKGAWGIWFLPGSPEFHVKWTGVAEILGGLGLMIGGLYDAFAPVYTDCPNLITSAGILSDSAAALLLLTIVVTPANIYMYTHGARLPVDGPEIPVPGHAFRGIMQVVLFGLLYQMGQGTFDALL